VRNVLFGLHRRYERKCRDCGYVWTVTRANAMGDKPYNERLDQPGGADIPRGTAGAGVAVLLGDPRPWSRAWREGHVPLDHDTGFEEVKASQRCPRCGSDSTSIRAITRRHPASPPTV
jgi:rubredoxin